MADSIQILTRTLDILECLSKQKKGYGVTELANAVQLHKSTTYRILAALQDRGYVIKNHESEKYQLTTKIVQLSSIYLDQVELRTESYPYLKELATQTQQTVHLGILQGTMVLYLEKVLAFNNIRMYSQIGQTMPAYRTGMGKALIAALPDNQRDDLIAQISFLPHLPNTITNQSDFRQAIAEVVKNGYAIDDVENELGIRCIACTISDYTRKPIASISISGAQEEFEGEALQYKISQLKSTARKINESLGCFETV